MADKGKEKKPASGRGKNQGRQAVILVLLLFLLVLLEVLGTSCFFASILGIPCPGCGSSRAFLLLLQGQFGQAIRMHPLILVSLAILIAVPSYFIWAWQARKKDEDWQPPLSPRAARILLFSLAGLYLLVYLVRMILYFPHEAPMCYRKDSLWGRLILLIRHIFNP